MEAESGDIVCSCVINTEFVIWIYRQRLLTDYASLKSDCKQLHIINDIFLSWYLWHYVKHKFEIIKLICALLFFNLLHYLKNKKSENMEGERGWGISSCCLCHIELGYNIQNCSFHVLVRHMHELTCVGACISEAGESTDLILCLCLHVGRHYQYWCQWQFFQSFHWKLDWIST